MRKQTKLVAVLSASALLAIGASMTSFAASPWVEENGTWVYYEKNGEKATEVWRKSGDKWYWLDESGEMAMDTLVENDNNYYYVDENGAMVTNRWVALPNEDYDGDDTDEPMNWWYYFGANGKAYKTNNSNTVASFKTINGRKYIFDDEGKMLYGWIDAAGERQTGDEAWQNGVYYCGDENDGAQKAGQWMYLDIIDTGFEAKGSNMSSEFTFDDEYQTRWFWFLTNGRKVVGKDGYNINGKKYSFDQYGRMNAEWVAPKQTPDEAKQTSANGTYTEQFRYYGSPEDGARQTKGFFKVVPDYYLDTKDFNDDQERTYYADRNGNLVASKIETISGKKYAFNSYGEMQTGLKAIKRNGNEITGLLSGDNTTVAPFDTFDLFKENINTLQDSNHEYRMYFFGSDGVMRTGKQTVTIDGENYTFLFNKSGSEKGAGKNGVDNYKYYVGGMLLAAERSDKYAVVKIDESGAVPTYHLLTTDDFLAENNSAVTFTPGVPSNKNADKYDEYTQVAVEETVSKISYRLVNTAGTTQKSKSKAKDGDGRCFDVNSSGDITDVYVES